MSLHIGSVRLAHFSDGHEMTIESTAIRWKSYGLMSMGQAHECGEELVDVGNNDGGRQQRAVTGSVMMTTTGAVGGRGGEDDVVERSAVDS